MAKIKIKPGLAVDDGAAVHLRGEEVWRVVRSRPQARVYRLEVEGGEIKETALETIEYSDFLS